ncbi:MAG TPA: serine/threonine-protein kinase [Planctomycetota bacterium]|nr:serine/threonine-protein kinase [Planctomycetota bacterium]
MKTPSSFKVGRILGKCQLLELIGRGGMGSVYLAKHLFLHRVVAVKLLKWTFSDLLERSMEAFETGARALARLNHPNIATIYDIDEEDGRPYIVMEFVDGQDVSAILKKRGSIRPSTAVAIALHVSRALEHAHAQGVVHRDIKPSNILLSKKGEVKVIDFGLAVEVAHPRPSTESPYVEGTPHYLSPEQARGRPLDGRSDLYSLGISLYEMLCGSRPFGGATESSVMEKHLEGIRPSLPIQESASAAPLAVFLSRMMALRPDDRYPNARAASDDLERYLEKWPASSSRRRLR